MNPAVEIRHLVTRELRKSVRSVKGIILGIITLVMTAIAVWFCVAAEGDLRSKLGAMSTEQFNEMRRSIIEKATGDGQLAAYLSTVPVALLGFLKFSVWLGPLIVALMGFDTIAGDVQYRSIRYWTVRTRRSSYFIGKFLSLWLLVSIVTLALNAVSGGVILAKGYVSVGALFRWLPLFWAISLPISAAWVAIAIFISAQFKTPILALLTTFVVFFVLWLFGVVAFFSHLRDEFVGAMTSEVRWYEYLYPSGYDTMLLSPKPLEVVRGLGILLGFSGVLVGIAGFSFQRRDV